MEERAAEDPIGPDLLGHDEYRGLVVRLIRDNWAAEAANLSVHRHDEVLPLRLAPTVADRAALAAYWADECGHAIRFAGLLEDLGAGPADDEYDTDRPGELLKLPITTWGEFGLFQLFADTAGCIHLADYSMCSYEPLQIAARDILHDEARHVRLGLNNLAGAIRDPGQRATVVAVVPAWAGAALTMFGRSDRPSRRDEAMVQWGLRKSSNAELRVRYISRIEASLSRLGLPRPGWSA